MKRIHIIYIVESNSRHDWLERLLDFLQKKEFSQSVITIEPTGSMHRFIQSEFPTVAIGKNRKRRLSIMGGVSEILKSRKPGHHNIVFALGHPAAFMSAISTLVSPLKFVFSHMQQPNFFTLYKRGYKKFIHISAYKFYVKRSSIIHSLSAEVDEALELIKIDQNKILKVNIGIDFNKIKNQLNSRRTIEVRCDDDLKLLMVGRLAQEKNYELAVESFSILARDTPNVKLYIAGEGPLGNFLKQKVYELELQDRVIFLGRVENVPLLMKDCDLLLHLAKTESYGQIYIEALVCDLPVLCTRTGIAINFEQDGVGSFFVLPEVSPQNIADEIRVLLTRQDRNAGVKKQSSFDSLMEHDLENVFEVISKSFKSLV
jgi:glycosyltransferase involved in cell wall biosynthesis